MAPQPLQRRVRERFNSSAALVRRLGGHHMNLSAPTLPVFLVSIILAILAAVVMYGGVKIPVVSGNTFATLLIGYVVLLAGNLFKGI